MCMRVRVHKHVWHDADILCGLVWLYKCVSVCG